MLIERVRFEDIITVSTSMQPALLRVKRVTIKGVRFILLEGESGTGKELVARAIHSNGSRANRCFLAVNSAAIAETLAESELFGHERGAFTGALRRKMGFFEQADGGTLFLDEIGDLSLEVQAKLLRVLEDGVITRVGGEKPICVNVIVIAATNRDLQAEVKAGRFRKDLYYRIGGMPVRIPPLRQRPEDIRPLLDHFLKIGCALHGNDIEGYTPEALDLLVRYGWPGNVRELKGVVEQLIIDGDGPVIGAGRLPAVLKATASSLLLKNVLARAEDDHIERVLRMTDGDCDKAAGVLGISRSKLFNRRARHRAAKAPQPSPEVRPAALLA